MPKEFSRTLAITRILWCKLMMGNIFTNREFEIIKLIGSGLSSEQIAGKIFITANTVNTHRRNILKKTGKSQISELIYDLTERGMF